MIREITANKFFKFAKNMDCVSLRKLKGAVLKDEKEPNVLDFNNVISFLQSYYEYRKDQNPSFSYQIWAQELDFYSRSYLRLVVNGKRPVSDLMISMFQKHFQFKHYEAMYFEMLVRYAKSDSEEQKSHYKKKIESFHNHKLDREMIIRQTEFLADPFLPALRTLCGFQDFPTEPIKIAEFLKMDLNFLLPKLDILKKIGAIDQNNKAQQSWKVESSFQALGHQEFYLESFRNAAKAIDLPFEIRRFRSLFLALNFEEFEDLMRDFEFFALEQLEKRNFKNLENRKLYQVNFNLFPMLDLFLSKDHESLLKNKTGPV